MPTPFSAEERARITERLLETGRRLFTTQGLRKTSLDDLVAPAGIAKSSFYAFFDSKEALYLELMLRQAPELHRQLAAVLDEAHRRPRGPARFPARHRQTVGRQPALSPAGHPSGGDAGGGPAVGAAGSGQGPAADAAAGLSGHGQDQGPTHRGGHRRTARGAPSRAAAALASPGLGRAALSRGAGPADRRRCRGPDDPRTVHWIRTDPHGTRRIDNSVVRMEFVRGFERIDDSDALAGGKGGALARLHQAGYPVPDGFVVLTTAFEGDALKPAAWDQVRDALAKLRDGRTDRPFAVRSSARSEDSAQASFAGESRPCSTCVTTAGSGARSRRASLAPRRQRLAYSGRTAWRWPMMSPSNPFKMKSWPMSDRVQRSF